MKKNLIKIISVLTAIMILSGIFTGIDFAANAAGDISFEEDFNAYVDISTNALRKTALENKGWTSAALTNTKAGYAATGKYVVPKDIEVYFANSGLTGAEEWGNYTIEMDVCINSAAQTRASNTYAVIVMNTSVYNAGGYEFGFAYTKDGKNSLILRRRKLTDSYDGISYATKDYNFAVDGSQTYRLKLEYNKGVLKGYVNGTLEVTQDISADDVMLTKGYAGFRKNGKDCEVAFDNFNLYETPDGFFSMPFTGSYTGSALTAMGYTASGAADVNTTASYISGGKITYPKDMANSAALFAPSINQNNYKIVADFVVEEKYGSGTPTYGLLIGAPTAEAKNCYYLALQVSGSKGYVQGAKVRTYNQKGNGVDVDGTSVTTSSADRTDYTYFGAKMQICAEITYNPSTDKSTINFSLISNGKVIFTIPVEHEGTLKGYSAIYSSKYGLVSFDNFKGQPLEAPKDENNYFFDDFEDDKSMTENGWSNDTSATKQNGKATLLVNKSLYTNNVTDSDKWTDYAVTAQVQFDGITELPTDSSTYIMSIVARSTKTASEGYEFSIRASKNGTYFQLYKRPNTGGAINGEIQKVTKDLDLTKTYKLKMIVMGARVLCWCDDELIFDITDNYADEVTYAQGYAGIRNSAYNSVVFDNFTVRKITDEEKQFIESITPELPPEPTPPPPPSTDENILFSDNFEGSHTMVSNGWNVDNAGERVDGGYTLYYNKAIYVSKLDGSDKWEDYVVEADLRYNNAVIEEGVGTVVNIVARSNNTVSDGYEFGVRIDGEGNTYVRLYKRGIPAGKINNSEHSIPYTVLPDTYYHAKMVVKGDRIICYFNGIKMFDIIDKDAHFEKGYAGIRNAGSADKVGYTATYKDFVVRKINETDIVEEEPIKKLDGKVWFKDNFDAETSLTERGWNTDAPNFSGGAVTLVDGANSLFISNVKDAEKWKDYTIVAKVEIDKEKGFFSTGTTWANTAIVARATKTQNSGYEFGIVTNSATGAVNLRLRNLSEPDSDKQKLMTISNVSVSEGVHELKMTCQGNVIRCYFDGELVITATDNYNSSGYAGIKASGYVTKFDDFKVGEIVEDEVLNLPAPEQDKTNTSPLTGVVNYIAPICFVISLLGLVVVAVFAIINRKKIFN